MGWSFFLGVCVCVGGGGSGTPWVVTYATSGLLPDNTGSRWEMSNFWGQTIIALFYSKCGFKL